MTAHPGMIGLGIIFVKVFHFARR